MEVGCVLERGEALRQGTVASLPRARAGCGDRPLCVTRSEPQRDDCSGVLVGPASEPCDVAQASARESRFLSGYVSVAVLA
jgi:hypothetical protein